MASSDNLGGGSGHGPSPHPKGVYILANDVVYDQVIALINSIEANVSPELPIALIPYDERLDRFRQEVARRPNLSIFEEEEPIRRWETFAREVWAAHPLGGQKKYARLARVRMRYQRRYAAFDGPFEKFVVYDGDCLAMKPLEDLFDKLDHYDFVFDDWEHAKGDAVAALKLDAIAASGAFTAAQVRPKLHCASFFGSRRGLLDRAEMEELQGRLIRDREVEWINGVSEAFLFCYMTLRGGGGTYRLFNYTLSPEGRDRTGNCADADPFVSIDNVLYNQQGQKPIHRIHYMNFPSSAFTRLAAGEAVDVPFRDVFLHYRYLREPDQRPAALVPPPLQERALRLVQKAVKKLKR